MAGAFNLTTQGLLSASRIDPSAQRLQQMANIPNQFNPTSTRIMAISEQDKQNDENATFIFEYRALLSSRLQQLITKLTNAFTSDLDGAMGAGTAWGKVRNDNLGIYDKPQGSFVNGYNAGTGVWTANTETSPWGAKNAMQGAANSSSEDPGAARATYAYFSKWGTVTHDFPSDAAAYGTNATQSSLTAGGKFYFTAHRTFQVWYDTDADGVRDELSENVDVGNPGPSGESFLTAAQISGGSTSLQSGGSADLLGAYRIRFNPRGDLDADGDVDVNDQERVVGLGWNENDDGASEFQRALAKSFQKREFQDILKWGFIGTDGDAVYIASTTSSASGSQLQSTLKLEYTGDDGGGHITIKQDRWTAFYHS